MTFNLENITYHQPRSSDWQLPFSRYTLIFTSFDSLFLSCPLRTSHHLSGTLCPVPVSTCGKGCDSFLGPENREVKDTSDRSDTRYRSPDGLQPLRSRLRYSTGPSLGSRRWLTDTFELFKNWKDMESKEWTLYSYSDYWWSVWHS